MKKILLGLFCLSTIIFANEITVSIVPQEYFVKKIVGDKMDVNVMVKPGSSPATYEPKVSQMRKLTKSKIYFSIGVPFEKVWLDKFANANKKMLIVDTSKGISKIEMEEHEHHDEEHHNDEKESHDEHSKHDEHDDHDKHESHEKHDEHDDHEKHDEHDEHEGHDHSGLDPHIWLDPILVKTQAKNIYEAVASLDAQNRDFYKTNYENFIKELDLLDGQIKNLLSSSKDKAFMVFHPSWGYFAKRYDLEQIAIEVQGKEPKPSQLVELVGEAKEHGIKIVFVAPQFSKKGAKTISRSINGNAEIIDPLAKDWDKNLVKVAQDIANTYK